jgi:kumamolisin
LKEAKEPMADRTVFSDSVVPLPDQPGLAANGVLQAAGQPDMTQRMTLMFSLKAPPEKEADLEAKVAAGEVVPADQLHSQYGGSADVVSKLSNWLTQNGFRIESVSKDNTAIYASAPLSAIESALGVHLVPVTKEGIAYTVARDAPSLPSTVADGVDAIIGLQPYRQARKHLRRSGFASMAPDAPAGAPNSRPYGYLVSDILGAYGVTGVTATGAGQVIAILIDTFPADGDLAAFWKANNIAVDLARIEKVNVAGGNLPAPSGEETLDAEWTSGIAPGAKIRVYASGSLDFASLDQALDQIIGDLPSEPGLRQLSISLGLGELYFGPAKGEIRTQHAKFLRLAAAGVNVFVSSGDAGSNPDSTGHDSTGPTQVEYEASDPSVIGVGGTTLVLGANGSVAAETAWSGSGGGKSVVFPRPGWQAGDGIPAGTQRLVPDVSAAADPSTGGMIVLQGQALKVGGTSWAAPIWAAFCALINDARQQAGKAALGFLNPQLYPVGASSAFRDITQGSNGAYDAGPGYDMVTGLGTPNAGRILAEI